MERRPQLRGRHRIGGRTSSSTTEPLLTAYASYGRLGSSARVRIFDWLDHFGLDARTHTYLGGSSNSLRSLCRAPLSVVDAERRLRSQPDAPEARVLISRRASPFSRGEVEERILRRSSHGVYDFDDAIMLAGTSLAQRAFPSRLQWRRAVQAADVVIAGNDWLAERTSGLHRDVRVIPSCVEPDLYPRKPHYERSAAPRAVWLGSPATEHYLLGVRKALIEAHRQTGLRLTVVSAGNASLGELGGIVDRVTWSAHGFAAELVRADFGIMPLQDAPWARGKCAYKLLQYGAAGLPTIADPVGANQDVLRLTGGYAPRGPEEWVDALVAMAQLAPVRAEALGVRAAQAVAANYSFAAWEHEWLRALDLPHVVEHGEPQS